METIMKLVLQKLSPHFSSLYPHFIESTSTYPFSKLLFKQPFSATTVASFDVQEVGALPQR